MLTRIAPIFAVAYCTITHSTQLGAQIPTRSPVRIPARSSPPAAASHGRVELRVASGFTSWWRLTSAGRSANRAAVRWKWSPIVSPSSGVVDVPWL